MIKITLLALFIFQFASANETPCEDWENKKITTQNFLKTIAMLRKITPKEEFEKTEDFEIRKKQRFI